MKGQRKGSPLLRFKNGDGVEVSSNEDGFRGVWFPATIVKKLGLRNGFLIEYKDLITEDGKPNSKLRETVKAPHIRPLPPALNRQCFGLNEVVDAFDRDGWRRGVVKAVLPHNNKYVVCFQDTKEQREYHLEQLRVHQDWTNDKWVKASDVETVGLNELNPNFPLRFTENMENICLESMRRSTCANENRSETKVLQLSGECKADEQCGNLEAVGSQLTSKSSKRKRGTKDQSNYDPSCKRKFPSEKGLEGIGAEDEENLRDSDAVGPKGDLHKDQGSPVEVETITISMPYMEYVDQNVCSQCNTPGIRGKTTLRQIQLLAYHSVLKALYLQKTLDWKHEILLTDLRDVLHINNEEHAKELRCITSGQYN